MDHARGPDNFYAPFWLGSPSTSFDAVGSVTALDVLNAALSFVDPEEHDSSVDDVRTMKSHTGVIAGGVGGAVFILLAIAACSWLYRRKRRRAGAKATREMFDGSDSASEGGDMIVEPLDIQPYPADRLGMDMHANGSTSAISAHGSLHAGGGRSSTAVTVGHRSKLQRLTALHHRSPLAYEEVENALPASLAENSGRGPSRGSVPASPASIYEDIPGLVHVLFNNLVEGHAQALRPRSAAGQYRDSEAPPQYEDEAGEQRRAS